MTFLSRFPRASANWIATEYGSTFLTMGSEI
jgi:hypothetical protein